VDEYLEEFADYESTLSVCLRCGAVVPRVEIAEMGDYEDPRDKHYQWHRTIR